MSRINVTCTIQHTQARRESCSQDSVLDRKKLDEVRRLGKSMRKVKKGGFLLWAGKEVKCSSRIVGFGVLLSSRRR